MSHGLKNNVQYFAQRGKDERGLLSDACQRRGYGSNSKKYNSYRSSVRKGLIAPDEYLCYFCFLSAIII